MKKMLALAIGVIVLLGVIGCSSENSGDRKEPESRPTEPTSTQPAAEETKTSIEPLDLQVIESGYAVDENGYVHYGIGIENPNTDYEVNSFMVTITGRDESGKIVFSDEQGMQFLLAGGKCYFGAQAGNGTAPSTVEFSVKVSHDFYWVENDKKSFEIYTIFNPNEVVGDWLASYTGELTANAEWSDIGSAWISVIFRDESGQIVGGANSFTDISKEGETVPFEISVYTVPSHASYEIHAVPWY